jgi:hypothetical protein
MRNVTRACIAKNFDARERNSEDAPKQRPVETDNLLFCIKAASELEFKQYNSVPSNKEEVRLSVASAC